MFDFLFRGTATVASPLHVPAEDGEDDAGVADNGEKRDGADRESEFIAAVFPICGHSFLPSHNIVFSRYPPPPKEGEGESRERRGD